MTRVGIVTLRYGDSVFEQLMLAGAAVRTFSKPRRAVDIEIQDFTRSRRR